MTEEHIQRILSAEPTLPRVVEDRLAETCKAIRHSDSQRPARRAAPWRRTLLLAAAVGTLLAAACGAAYLAEHSSFFQLAFGDGTVHTRAAETKFDREGNWVYSLPQEERVPVDEEQAEALVGPHVADLDRSVTGEGYTFTFLSHLFDPVSGTGRIYYTVENPSGLEDIVVCEGDDEVSLPGQQGKPGPGLTFRGSRGSLTAARTYADPANSTEARLTLCTYYTCEGFEPDETIEVVLWTRRPEGADAPDVETCPTLSSFTLPVEPGMEGVTVSGPDGGMIAAFSAVVSAVIIDGLEYPVEPAESSPSVSVFP